jgi:hypothetical protein
MTSNFLTTHGDGMRTVNEFTKTITQSISSDIAQFDNCFTDQCNAYEIYLVPNLPNSGSDVVRVNFIDNTGVIITAVIGTKTTFEINMIGSNPLDYNSTIKIDVWGTNEINGSAGKLPARLFFSNEYISSAGVYSTNVGSAVSSSGGNYFTGIQVVYTSTSTTSGDIKMVIKGKC